MKPHLFVKNIVVSFEIGNRKKSYIVSLGVSDRKGLKEVANLIIKLMEGQK